MPKESYIDEQEQSAPIQSKITREETDREWFRRKYREMEEKCKILFEKDKKINEDLNETKQEQNEIREEQNEIRERINIIEQEHNEIRQDHNVLRERINIIVQEHKEIREDLNEIRQEQNEIRERINKLNESMNYSLNEKKPLITACKENQPEVTLLIWPILSSEEELEVIQPEVKKYKQYPRPRVTDSTPYSLYMLNVFIEAIISWFQEQFSSATRNIYSFFSNSVSTVDLKNEEYLPQATNA